MTVAQRKLTTEDVDLIERLAYARAREDYWYFRRLLRPELILGWWIECVASELQAFYNDMVKGLRPKLVLMAPPQHGKSFQLTDFLAWVAGRNPDLKTIFASYSEDLGVGMNIRLQRVYDSAFYQGSFPLTRISDTAVARAGRYARNSYLLEYIGRLGSFRNTTIEGQVTGQGLDLGVIDDPIKGRKEASSKVTRDGAWNWLTDDFLSRFSEYAGLILTMTRWHVDDPVGRFKEKFPTARILQYPAIAIVGPHDGDPRQVGEALFPQFKSLGFLLERKAAMSEVGWESEYQQNPFVQGGGMFPVDRFKFVDQVPTRDQVRKAVRYWDKAGTAGGGAFSAGVLFLLLKDDRQVVADVHRGQWAAFEREKQIADTCEWDNEVFGRVVTWVEQEPGSGGLESAERTIANLKGYTVKKDRVTGSKEVRADPYAAQVQGGNILLVKADWNQPFLDEHEVFPNGKYKDQVDAAAGAHAKVTDKSYGYDTSLSGV